MKLRRMCASKDVILEGRGGRVAAIIVDGEEDGRVDLAGVPMDIGVI